MFFLKFVITVLIFAIAVTSSSSADSKNVLNKRCTLTYELIYEGGYFKSIYGLGKSTTNNTIENIDFGFYTAGNSLAIIEKGLVKGLFGTYQSGDVFEIEINDSVASYYRNERMIYNSYSYNDFKNSYIVKNILIDKLIKNFNYKNVVCKCNF
jgi:hypothetical protein